MSKRSVVLFSILMLAGMTGGGVIGAYAKDSTHPQPAPLLASVGTGITYQGYLTDGGLPATGEYDFEFILFDSPSAGVDVSSVLPLNDVAVNDGTFSVVLDFGSVFSSQALWLEIHVRPGASSGGYTTLTPRQAIKPAPVALGLPNLYTNQSEGFVGVGRSTQIVSEERFGVHVETSGYGGMYVNTSGASGLPFYGYATDGSAHSWTFYEGSSGKWKLNNNGTQLTVQNNGYVGIGTYFPNSALQVAGNYIQFPTRSGAPPAADCDSTSEYGRVVVRIDGATNLYVCTSSGWMAK